MVAVRVEQGIGTIKKNGTNQTDDQQPAYRQYKSKRCVIPFSAAQCVSLHENPPGKQMYHKFITRFSVGKGEKCKIIERKGHARCVSLIYYKIRQISPVAPSFTMRVRLPRNLARTSSGVLTSLEVNPSCIRS